MSSYLVVGASRGLGYAWLQHLSLSPNNTVIGLVRTPGPVLTRLSGDNIKNVHILPADMASPSSLTLAASTASSLLPSGLDVLIINGAYTNPTTDFQPPTTLSSNPSSLHDDMHASLDVNILGVIHSINIFLPLLLKGEVKKIIVISTGLADPDAVLVGDGIPLFVTYSVMKAGLNMVVAKFGAELRGKGVTVLALSPGMVDTKETPPTEQELAGSSIMIDLLRKRAPSHWKGPLTPKESVELQMKVIQNVTVEDSGKFLSHWGDKNWL